MKLFNKQKNRGFTLVETMVAVFILTIALTSLLNLTTSSLFTALYSRNEMTANYLLQEAVDFVRNERDSVAFQQAFSGGGWSAFEKIFGDTSSSSLCFSSVGCYFDVNSIPLVVKSCSNTNSSFGTLNCPIFFYHKNAPNNSFYNYNSNGVLSVFKRKVYLEVNPNNSNELYVMVTVEWLNGKIVKSESLKTSLLNWMGSN